MIHVNLEMQNLARDKHDASHRKSSPCMSACEWKRKVNNALSESEACAVSVHRQDNQRVKPS